MANSDNLNPIKKGELSKDEAKRRGSKGGKARAESIKQKKTMREMLDYLLEKEITNNKGEKATTLEAMMTSVCKKAISGDVKANEFIRDTTGQKPIDKQEVVNTNLNIESNIDKAKELKKLLDKNE